MAEGFIYLLCEFMQHCKLKLTLAITRNDFYLFKVVELHVIRRLSYPYPYKTLKNPNMYYFNSYFC